MCDESEVMFYMETTEFEDVQYVVEVYSEESSDNSSDNSEEMTTDESHTSVEYYMDTPSSSEYINEKVVETSNDEPMNEELPNPALCADPLHFLNDMDKLYLSCIQHQEREMKFISLESETFSHREFWILTMTNATNILGIDKYSLYTAAHVMDKYVNNHTIDNYNNLVQTAAACLHVACEFHMEGLTRPTLNEICEVIGCSYISDDHLKKLKLQILRGTNGNLAMPTLITFATFFGQFCIDNRDLQCWRENHEESRLQQNLDGLLHQYVTFALNDASLTQVCNSFVAASCVMGVRKALRLTPWPEFMEAMSGYHEAELKEMCTRLTNCVFPPRV